MSPRRSRPPNPPRKARDGFTLIELMVVIVIALLLVTLAAPSVRELLAVQRLQSVHAELVTDLQFARSEAVQRRQDLIFDVAQDAAASCYVLFTDTGAFGGGSCDCRRGPGQACTGAREEIRTVLLPRGTGVSFTATSSATSRATFERSTGYSQPGDFRVDLVSATRGALRATVNATGRVSSCSPDGSVRQVPRC